MRTETSPACRSASEAISHVRLSREKAGFSTSPSTRSACSGSGRNDIVLFGGEDWFTRAIDGVEAVVFFAQDPSREGCMSKLGCDSFSGRRSNVLYRELSVRRVRG
jgi:hypothetical protein